MKQNSAVKYGIIGAVILFVVGVAIQIVMLSYLKSAANDPSKFSIGKSILFSILLLLLVVGVYIYSIRSAMIDYRKIDPNYTYRKLVGQGLIATLILVVISTALSYLYNNVIAPETRQQTVELTKQVYQNLNIPDDQKQKVLEKLDEQNPGRELLTGVGLTLILGMIISFIGANILNANARMNNTQQMR